jgi:hypothetical protein
MILIPVPRSFCEQAVQPTVLAACRTLTSDSANRSISPAPLRRLASQGRLFQTMFAHLPLREG